MLRSHSLLLASVICGLLWTAFAALTELGADVSSAPKFKNQKYYDGDGKQADVLDILKAKGVNYARIRVWNNPSDGHSGKAEVLQLAKDAHAKGFKIMIDFHYSDSWADPGKQTKPSAWSSHTIDTLTKDLHDFTLEICNALKSQGTTPDSIQVGNEINTGMLWPDGKVNNDDFKSLGKLLNAGYEAVKSCNSGTKVVVHVADADSDAHARWFFDGIKSVNVSYDIIGLSYYCFWHGSMASMQSVVSDLKSRYGKPVWMVETAYPTSMDKSSTSETCSGYDHTFDGQTKNFNDVASHARSGGATGLFYWEPTWIGERSIFDSSGKANPSFKWSA